MTTFEDIEREWFAHIATCPGCDPKPELEVKA